METDAYAGPGSTGTGVSHEKGNHVQISETIHRRCGARRGRGDRVQGRCTRPAAPKPANPVAASTSAASPTHAEPAINAALLLGAAGVTGIKDITGLGGAGSEFVVTEATGVSTTGSSKGDIIDLATFADKGDRAAWELVKIKVTRAVTDSGPGGGVQPLYAIADLGPAS